MIIKIQAEQTFFVNVGKDVIKISCLAFVVWKTYQTNGKSTGRRSPWPFCYPKNNFCVGMTSQDDALRRELEGVINGLQDYLKNVRKKSDEQREELDQLLDDKEKLIRKLADLEEEKARLEADIDDYKQLQQQVIYFSSRVSDVTCL